MRRYWFFGLWFLAGCTSVAPSVNIASDQLFKGYPCFEYCQEFQLGFERAERREFTEHKSCDFPVEYENLGCKAYVQEYKAEHEADVFIDYQKASTDN